MTTGDQFFRYCALIYFIQATQAVQKVQFYNDFEISSPNTDGLDDYLAIDVSHYHGVIDWSLIPKDKVQYSFIKATQGAKYVDPMFIRNWNEAGKQELWRGVYHFFSVTDSPESQVANIASTLKKVSFNPGLTGPYDIMAIDVEGDSCSADVTTMSQNLLSVIHQLEEMYAFRVFIYTRANYWDSCVNTTWYYDWMLRPLWISYYSDTATKPILPKPWAKDEFWTFWQFTETGSMPGIKGHVDLSYVRGTVPVANNSNCDSDCCSGACYKLHMTGYCLNDECRCFTGPGCHDMVPSCDLYCKALSMEEECDNQDECACKVPLEPCLPSECIEACAEWGKDHGCFIPATPVWCMEYGPFGYCGCHCPFLPHKARGKSVGGKKGKGKMKTKFGTTTSGKHENDV
ncbi:Lysozyme M1 [Folsomia candida]|uniref:Lysozyme M1 n=1 Tax=Folsomia candida TaxID=158441 RepID=A0A226DHS3_FOLCA|nr:Lysozyme M1 [Folsomia candida]